MSAKITIDVPREQAFAFLAELANRPSFTDHFISPYRLQRIPSSGVGSAARFRTGPRLNRVWMETVIDEVEAELSRCDLLVSIGTSAVVYPAAQMPLVAKSAGATLVEINPEDTPMSEHFDVHLRGPATEMLARI